jgi:predicted ABC-type ATPase
MWIVAGPNGAGTSAFAGEFLKTIGIPPVRKVNTDEVTVTFREKDRLSSQDALNLKATLWRLVATCVN